MPLSEKRLAANRANSLKSTGPKTRRRKPSQAPYSREGQENLATCVVIEGESREIFFKTLAGMIGEFEPATPEEYATLEIMVAARWRRYRSWAIEVAGFNHEQRTLSDATLVHAINPVTRAYLAMCAAEEKSRHADRFERAELRHDRIFQRAEDRLLRLQEKRKKQHESHQLNENKEEASETKATKPNREASKPISEPTAERTVSPSAVTHPNRPTQPADADPVIDPCHQNEQSTLDNPLPEPSSHTTQPPP